METAHPHGDHGVSRRLCYTSAFSASGGASCVIESPGEPYWKLSTSTPSKPRNCRDGGDAGSAVFFLHDCMALQLADATMVVPSELMRHVVQRAGLP